MMRTVLAEKAKHHTDKMDKESKSEISYSTKNSVVYGPEFIYKNTDSNKNNGTEISLVFTDSVTAIVTFCEPGKRIAVLNFASYKNPGGQFLSGSNSQEECLCHESFLYNVLREFDDTYYKWNREHLNKALYLDRALYVPNVTFTTDEDEVSCDVITCASPNKGTFCRYNSDIELNYYYLRERIRFVLGVAFEQEVDILILGAFGCGVFKQNPEDVASIFDEFLQTEYKDVFDHVVFAIPDKNGKNYKAFEKVFGGSFNAKR